MAIYYYDLINTLAENNPEMFINQCENNYKSAIVSAADQFLSQGKTIIMLSGPSSSGKTTTAKILMNTFRERGLQSNIVSLDDFYLDDEDRYPRNEDGTFDFESPFALDLDLIRKDFRELIEKGFCSMPVFDFETHRRRMGENNVTYDDHTIILVEGIHGLNPYITRTLPAGKMGKLYVSVSSRIYDRDNGIMMPKREIRLVRRLVRDYKFRNTSVDETFFAWPSVCKGEGEFIFPFRNQADIKVDSFHPYEMCMLSGAALEILSGAKEDFLGLRKKLKKFKQISTDLMPEDSMLHEFLG